jgi:hypothetical protein
MKMREIAKFAFAIAAVIAISGSPMWGADKEPVILVTRLNGTLKYKRPPSTVASNASVGTVLKPGDVLMLTGDAQVLCSDASVHKIDAGAPSPVPCPVGVQTISYNGKEVFGPRGPQGFVPVVLAPRMTHLLSINPQLRWRGLPGISSYTLTLIGPDGDWSKKVSGETPMKYPADAPPLKAGASYLLTITAEGIPEVDETPNLGFSIATDSERQQVALVRGKIAQADLDSSLKPLMDAAVLASYGFHAEAIDELMEQERKSQSALVYRLLANSYYSIALYNEALAAMQKAFALYSSGLQVDATGSAWAKLHIGLLYSQIGDSQKAAVDLQDAKSRFTALGLDDEAQKVQGYLQLLSQ